MNIIFITHASAAKVNRGTFRPLSEEGLIELDKASGIIKSYLSKYSLSKIDGMVSSSAIRCVNTAIKLAESLIESIQLEISDSLVSTHLLNEQVDRLGAKIPISYNDLRQSIKDSSLEIARTVLLAVHSEFATLLPHSRILPENIKDGFFISRPIVGLFQFSTNSPGMTDNDLMECYDCSSGKNILKETYF